MRKAISLLLAMIMAATLFACGGAPAVSPSASPSAPASPSPTQPASPAATDTASPGGVVDVSASEDEFGFFSSGVDPNSRKTYEVLFAYPRNMTLMQNLTDTLEDFSKKLNYNLSTTTGDGDIDVYLQNIEVYASRGVDGIITNIDPSTSQRIIEVLNETGAQWMDILNSVRDENGSNLVPCATLDGYTAGESEIQWLYDNYKTYWGDIDTSQIGLISINWSPNVDLSTRHEGAIAKFKELLPNNDKIFTCDGVTGKMDADTGYNMTAPIFTANSDVKYWFVASCLEFYSQGAARAAEALKIDKNVLVTCVGSDVLSDEWNNGYKGCWVSCVAVADVLYVTPTICALVALMDGKATHETLWSQKRAPGDKATLYFIKNEIVTVDTYKEYFDRIEKQLEEHTK